MAERTIHMTKFDMDRLMDLIDRARIQAKRNKTNLDQLEQELTRAILMEPRDIPRDVVTMNSRVVITDVDSGETTSCVLVFPSDANASENRISVLAPLGTALLGYREGDVVEWRVPAGIKRLRVDQVLYQPEAAGDFHL
jgi:regulator of nucleoside diphosphate kinase